MGRYHDILGRNLGDITGMLLIALSLIGSLGLVATAQQNGQTGPTATALVTAICNVFNTVKTIIFILAILLFVLGGVLYAGSNMLPSSQRGEFQGYGMAMIIGGVVGLAITLAAPYVLNIVMSTNPQFAESIVATTGGGAASGTVGPGSINAASVCSSVAGAGGGGGGGFL
jgi:hypothetical protein